MRKGKVAMGIARYEIRQPKKGTAADRSEDETTGHSDEAEKKK